MKGIGEVADALSSSLGTIEGLRAYPYFPDTFQPPGVVVGHPDIDFETAATTVCGGDWTMPAHLVVARSNDRSSSLTLFDFLDLVIAQIDGDPTLGGVVNRAIARPSH